SSLVERKQERSAVHKKLLIQMRWRRNAQFGRAFSTQPSRFHGLSIRSHRWTRTWLPNSYQLDLQNASFRAFWPQESICQRSTRRGHSEKSNCKASLQVGERECSPLAFHQTGHCSNLQRSE